MTKYRLAEQCRRLLNLKSDFQQEVMILVNQAYASVVKANLFANKQAEGVMEINGNFVYSFDNIEVQKDENKDMYYIVLPSTAVDLPMEMGIYHVSLQKSQNEPFIKLPSYGLFWGLQCYNMEGRNKYFTENNKLYFPDFKDNDKAERLLVKLAVALNDISEDTELSIPPDIELAIIQLVSSMYQRKETPEITNGEIR